jgi:hypothetical protein
VIETVPIRPGVVASSLGFLGFSGMAIVNGCFEAEERDVKQRRTDYIDEDVGISFRK